LLEDFSQHLLDIAENSMNAGASIVEILLTEDRCGGWFYFEVRDNGKGMSADVLQMVADPFFTSRTTRRVGFGLPFLKQLAELCEGEMEVQSEPGKGTRVWASFRYDHIDRPPLGNIPASLVSLLVAHPEVRLIYHHRINEEEFTFDSSELARVLEDPGEVQKPKIARWLQEYFSENLKALNQTTE
jgi:hypothetical protein